MKTPLRIILACTLSDRTRPILDGRVHIDGCDASFVTGEPEDLFARALRTRAFDITELSLSSHILLTARGDAAYVGVPAFPSRAFRHSAVYVRSDRGIERPEDLSGKTIGVPEYQQTAGLWMRGILSDDHGVSPSSIRWRSGGLERPGSDERIPIRVNDDIDLAPIPRGATLSAMLAGDQLDGVISPRPPSCFIAGDANVKRLWRDPRAVERAFFQRTRLFPIMHVVAIKAELVHRHPWLPVNVLKAFADAKQLAIRDLEQTNFLRVTLPWIDLDRVRELMGEDFWPYGLAPNRRELDAVARWSFGEGLAARRLSPEELFDASTTTIPANG